MDTLVSILFWFCVVIGVIIGLFLCLYLVEGYHRVMCWLERRKEVAAAREQAENELVDKLEEFAGNIRIQTPVKPEVIRNCTDLKFSDFIKVDVNKDYSVLIKAGEPTENDLFAAWICILSEYYTLTGNRESTKHINLVWKIERLNTKILQVKALIGFLRMKYMPKLIQGLRGWGYEKPFTEESYIKDLKAVEAALKNDAVKLQQAKLQYQDEEEAKQRSGAKAATLESYTKALVAISNYTKRHIRAVDISTMEYCIMYKELSDYSAAAKAQK